MIVLWVLVLIVSIVALVKGADWFTEGAESIGIRYGIPSFIVGIVIVSIGTSLPELASSITAVLKGNSEMVLANVVGSNIANIFFVLGLGAFISGVKTSRNITQRDIPILLGSSALLLLLCLNGVFGLWESLLFILLALAYILKGFSHKTVPVEDHFKGKKVGWVLTGGLALVIVGAQYLVEAVIHLSLEAGISTAVISASVVAFGTSVPEAVVTVVAVIKKQREIALGNIIGSNVFNVLLITGISGIFGPLLVPKIILTLAIPVMFIATLLLGWWMRDKKLDRHEGFAFLFLYVAFLAILFVQTP